MRRLGTVAVAASLLVTGLVATPSAVAARSAESAESARATTDELVRTVTYGDQTLTLRLHPVTVRAPGFEVLVQQPTGTYLPASIPEEHSYLGGVDGLPSAVSTGIVDSNGTFQGIVVFDRGGTWEVSGSSVVSTRGLTQPTSYHWPSAADAALNVTTTPGQVGVTTRRWDLGYDLASAWFSDAGTVNASVAEAIDDVQLGTVELTAAYEVDALLQPAIRRVVIRASSLQDPYADGTDLLGKATSEWKNNQADAGVDDVALWNGGAGGGGVAWVATAGTSMGVSSNGGHGVPWVVTRHELGHTWSAHDNHTNGPEGATINSGNAYHRFDGTELSAIMRYRDNKVAGNGSLFTRLPRFAVPVPPYAALDLVGHQTSGVGYSFRPTANDHDANADKVSLASVWSHSQLGGSLTRVGDVVTYVPPKVTSQSVDWFEYVARDSTGRTANGVALLKVDPYVAPPPVSGWPRISLVPHVAYRISNTQSGLYAGTTDRGAVVQRSRGGNYTRFVVMRQNSAYKLRSLATGRCLAAGSHNGLVVEHCRPVDAQRWGILKNPEVGTAIVSIATGRCVAPAPSSILGKAPLRQVRCGLSLAQSWTFRPPAATEWKPINAPTGTLDVVQVASGLRVGVPAGTTGSALLYLRPSDGAATQATFTRNSDGTYAVTSAATGQCFDVYGGSTDTGAEVGTWGCHGGTNQQWRLLAHPAGGFALRNVGSGLCLSSAGTSEDSAVVQQPCDLGRKVRWRVS